MFHPRQENCNRAAEIRYFRKGLIGKAKEDYLAASRSFLRNKQSCGCLKPEDLFWTCGPSAQTRSLRLRGTFSQPIGSGFRDKFHREVPVYGTKARTVLTPNRSLECDESRPYSKGSTWKILQRCERIVSP